jgi:hypothetical protein
MKDIERKKPGTRMMMPEASSLFRAAKTQVLADNSPARGFIWEMLDFGERCFMEVEKRREYAKSRMSGRSRKKEEI